MKIIKWTAALLLSLMIPFFVIIGAIRVLLTPVFYQVEYRMPYFPPDPYGFQLDDRLWGAQLSIDYLLNDTGLEFFDQYQLTDGSPFYNARELSHMLDVKLLVHKAVTAWRILLAVLVLAGMVAQWKNKRMLYWKALSRGGLWTLILIASVLVFVLLSFSSLFTQFHMLFFTGDTWLFEFSDTLIRLFPMQFWQDAFIWVGVLSALQAGLLFVLGRRWSKSSG